VLPDIVTVFLIISVNKFLLGLLMLHLKFRTPHIKGINEWAYGSILTSLGLLVNALFPYQSNQITSFLYSFSLTLLIMSGDVFFLKGFLKFNNKQGRYLYLFSIPLVSIINNVLFTLVFDSLLLRFSINMLLFAILYFISGLYLMKKTEKSYQWIYRASAVLYLFFSLINILRLGFAFISTPQTPHHNHTITVIFLSIAGVLIVLLTYFLIVLINTKLQNELLSEIETKNKLYAIISHDLREPISVFTNNLFLMKSAIKSSNQEETESYFESLEKSSLHTRYMLENLLYWSKSRLKEIYVDCKQNNLYDIVQTNIQIFQTQAMEKNITISCNMQSSMYACFDYDMINIVIRNVMSNALKFTHNNGVITIHAVEDEIKVTLYITDNGIGISQKRLNQLFDKKILFTTKGTNNEKGSGIGLPLSKEFVEKNNGKFLVESSQNEGSTFAIVLLKHCNNKYEQNA